MVRTLDRPPTGGDQQQEHDFLHGIDLGRIHLRQPRSRRPWLLAGSVMLAALIVALLVFVQPSEVPYAAHDSGIAQAIQTHDALPYSAHDSGIAQAIQTHDALPYSAHDSGIAQALDDR